MTTALLAFAFLSVKFQGPAQELLDLSEDEQWVLARHRHIAKCKTSKRACQFSSLAVFEAAAGRQVATWEGDEGTYLQTARFLTGNGVQATFTRAGTTLLQRDWRVRTKAQTIQLRPRAWHPTARSTTPAPSSPAGTNSNSIAAMGSVAPELWPPTPTRAPACPG